MLLNDYQELNLPAGARPSDIKAAFRRLAKASHPDAVGRDKADVEKFIRAQSAYQNLMKSARKYKEARTAARTAPEAASQGETGRNWRFESEEILGLDIYCTISMVRTPDREIKLILPWQVREACPRCLGQGQTLASLSGQTLYRPQSCSRCGGSGTLSRASKLETVITPAMAGKGRIRLRQAGLYQPKTAQRGDLIIKINWVDQLPQNN